MTDDNPSADKVLEDTRNTTQDVAGAHALPEDNAPPAAPATPPSNTSLPVDQPQTDSGMDADETYQAGSDAAGPAPAPEDNGRKLPE
jgi:hypothetical protein